MLQDSIADMLTRIRNACLSSHSKVLIKNSKINRAIAQVLQEEGYIREFVVQEDNRNFYIYVKYYKGKSVIEKIERASKPSRRIYVNTINIPKVCGGFGIAIISTSKGLLTDFEARKLNLGGEVICYVQ